MKILIDTKIIKNIYLDNQLHVLWKLSIECRIHTSPPVIPILNQINPFPRIDSNFFDIYSNIVLLRVPKPS